MTSRTRDPRPLLADVAEAGGGVRVRLTVRDRSHVGVAALPAGAPPASALVTAAAAATIDALEQATPQAVSLRLEWSEVVEPDDELPPLAVVLCTVTVADVPLRAPGSALLRGEPAWAGARAVLQGLNRRLEVLGL